MKKVLVFGITENPGGVESVIMNYYRHLDRSKVQFDFLCNTEKPVAYEEEIKELGGTIYRVTARSINRSKFKEDMNKFFLEHAQEYSTIWVNICSLANIDYLKYAKKFGIKYRIIHSHNSQNMDSKLRMLLHKANKCIISKYATDFWSCSEDSSKWFYSEKIIKSNKYLLVNNAIDTEKFKFNDEIRRKYRKKMNLENKFVIGNVGRFHFQKNHEFLIDIFKEISKKQENAYLLLVGQGEEENKIKNKVESMNLKDKVAFLGIRNDVDSLLQAMDAFLFPSLFEGLPLALIETQANGINIYAASEGIPTKAKMVDNFYFMSLKDSPEVWADKILENKNKARELENPKIIEKMGYSIEHESKRLQKYFERI